MAFPQIAAQAKGTGTGSGTTYALPITGVGTISAGDILIAAIGPADISTVTVPTGWIEILDANGNWYAWKYCDGTESSPQNFTGSTSNQAFMYHLLRITGACHVNMVASSASGTSTTPDPANFSPGQLLGALDYLWIATCAKIGSASPTGNPTNYTAGDNQNIAGGIFNVAWAYRQVNGSSENPGTFTYAGSSGWEAFTIAVWPNDRPLVRAVGTIQAGTGTITLTEPTGSQDGDLQIAVIETDQSESPTCTGWSHIPDSPQASSTDTTDTKLSLLYRIRSGAGTLTTNDPGDHIIGRVFSIIRGSFDSSDPFNVTAGTVENTADTSGSVPGDTTTRDNCLVVAAISHGNDPGANGTANYSAWTNADLTALTEIIDNTQTAGNGGGFGVAAGWKTTAGAYTSTTATLAVSSFKGLISLAINPTASAFIPRISRQRN